MKKLPRKKHFRQRAHANPFSEHCLDTPLNPEQIVWKKVFPDSQKKVTMVDVGCGYGGLLFELSKLFKEENSLGMEIRTKVSDYVQKKIDSLRESTGKYKNIYVIRTNVMKHLFNFFEKGQLTRMFFLYPDPHFKKKKHKARIINQVFLTQYAYLLKKGGYLYTATDVKELHLWMEEHLSQHPLFVKEKGEDLLVDCILNKTEEGIKVERNKGEKFWLCYKKV